MKKIFWAAGSAFCALVFFPLLLQAVDTKDTKLLTQPAISRNHIAFVYANDLWVADPDGKNVLHLTTDLGIEGYPAFSPDGSLIAFSAQYDGNIDVYVVSSSGGVPRRLTWHPGPDLVQDFTPDGQAVLFTSPRASYTGAYLQLYTVPVQGGVRTRSKSRTRIGPSFRRTVKKSPIIRFPTPSPNGKTTAGAGTRSSGSSI